MSKYKYSVLCFIVNGYEKVREVQNPDKYIEYVLVTDDPKLKSDTWKVVYDESLTSMGRYERCHNVKYNVFKYVQSDLCIYIDASIQLKGSLDLLVNDFNLAEADIALLSHPMISTFIPELQLWILQRGFSYIKANKFIEFLEKRGYNLDYKSHFLSGISIRRKTKFTKDFEKLVLSHMYYISNEDDLYLIDQLMADYVLNTYFNDKKVFLLSMQCLFSDKLQIYKHNTDEISTTELHYDLRLPDEAYCFGQLLQCYYLK